MIKVIKISTRTINGGKALFIPRTNKLTLFLIKIIGAKPIWYYLYCLEKTKLIIKTK